MTTVAARAGMRVPAVRPPPAAAAAATGAAAAAAPAAAAATTTTTTTTTRQKYPPLVARQGLPGWHLLDAKEQVVGRFAGLAARLLQGKHRPTYRPELDSKDWVVVINAAKVNFTGSKMQNKRYFWHTHWAGGLRSKTPQDAIERDKQPEYVITHAVSGMLPKNKLRRERLRRLRVFPGDEFEFMDKFPELASAVREADKSKKMAAAVADKAAKAWPSGPKASASPQPPTPAAKKA